MNKLTEYKNYIKADIDGMTAEQFYNFISQFEIYSPSYLKTACNLHIDDWNYDCIQCRKDNGFCQSEKHEDDPDHKENSCMKMFVKHCNTSKDVFCK